MQVVLLMWIIVGQRPVVLPISAVGVFRFFSLSPTISLLSSSLREIDLWVFRLIVHFAHCAQFVVYCLNHGFNFINLGLLNYCALVWQAKCTIILEIKVYKAKTMI